MKATAEKSTTTSRSEYGSHTPFFAKANAGGFFEPLSRRATPGVQTKLAVSRPGDPLEQEADRTADRVVRDAIPLTLTPPTRFQREPEEKTLRKADERFQGALTPEQPLQRKAADGVPAAGADVHSAITSKTTGGEPMSHDVRSYMEPRFGADFGNVRIHTDAESTSLNNHLSAQAFTYQNHIFFSRDQYQPGTSEGRHLLAHELTHTIQQSAVVQRSADVSVNGHGAPQVQRLGVGDALGYFAERANAIPGFRMLTIVLGLNPITMNAVDRSPANILRAMIEFIPAGFLITQALDAHGIVDRVATWVGEQVRSIGVTGTTLRQALDRYLASLSWSDILDLGGVWNRAAGIFSEPIDRLISFARTLGSAIVDFIKAAVLMPLARLAEGTRGWDLLIAVLGRNPITGEAVPRNADTLIGGFMKLIGQEEIWENLKRANAVARAWAWFQGALGAVLGFVQQIPALAMNAFRSLVLEDLILLPRAFAKVAAVFGNFVGNFVSWATNAVWDLLEIIFSVVAPGVMTYLRRAAAAFRTILRNPIGFVGNLVRAGVQGLEQFARNFLNHLRNALVGWLTGTLAGAGIYIPRGLTFVELVKFVLSVLGLTWQNIRQKLVRAAGETAVRAMETAFDLVVTLVRDGPAAAWQKLQEGLTNLREMVLEQIMTFVRDRVVQAAITRLVTSLNPAGAFIQAVIAIYNTVMFFVERMRQIAQVAASVIDSIAAIASGAIGAAANRVEQTMGGLLTLVISFLARIAGLGRISDAITNIINRVRAPIDRALDRVVNWIVTQARRLGRLAVRTAGRILQWWRSSTPFIDTRGQRHTIRFEGEERNARLVVESTPIPILDFLTRVRRAIDGNAALAIYRPFYDSAVYLTNEINGLVTQLRDSPREDPAVIQERHNRLQEKIALLTARPLRVLTAIDPAGGAAAATAGAAEYDVQRVHALVVAEARNTNANVLRGHGRYAPGYVGRSFSIETRDAIDAIGYADGDHSDPSIRTPGTSTSDLLAGTVSHRLNRPHWIPDHQPPNEIAAHGGQPVRFYPHSWPSARRQGGAVGRYIDAMTRRLGRPIAQWAQDVRAAWFW